MSLQSLRDGGYSITFYCPGYTTRRGCSVGWPANFDQLIQYFGLEAHPLAHEILSLVNCPVCEQPGESMIIQPPGKGGGIPWNASAWQFEGTPPMRPEAERNQQAEELRITTAYAETARAVAKELFSKEQKQRNQRKQIEVARDKGIFLIGPPSPWALRKKGRWL